MAAALEQLLGDFVMRGLEEKISTKSLFGKGKVLALYFSAHWCKACQTFTPLLKDCYKKIRRTDSGKNSFDIVFISSDNEEEEFKEYYGEMPWLALPYIARDKKAKLARKFRIQGIPALIILDADAGTVITTSGIAKVTSDPSGTEFPWKPRAFIDIIQGKLLRNKVGEVDAVSALKGKVVGLYISAHWCPPCRAFTPELINVYNRVRDGGQEFEVVFISKDRSIESFTQYFESMPWLGLPHGDKRTEDLISLFGVEGIPSLLILDKDGSIITRHGRETVRADPEGKEFPWYPKAVNLLTMDHVSQLNLSPCLILFTDGEESDLVRAQESLESTAEKEHQKGSDQELLFFYSNDDDFSDYLRDFTFLDDRNPLLVILDIPGRKRYIHPATEVTADIVKTFVEQYFSGKLISEPMKT